MKKFNRVKKISILLVILTLSSAYLYSKNYKKAKKLFIKAWNTKNKNLKIKLRKKIINLAPNTAYGFFCKAWFQHLKKNYTLAIKNLTKTINLKPNFWQAHFNRGVAYSKLNKYNLAIKDYTKAIEINPQDAKAYLNRAILYRIIGKIILAERDDVKYQSIMQNN